MFNNTIYLYIYIYIYIYIFIYSIQNNYSILQEYISYIYIYIYIKTVVYQALAIYHNFEYHMHVNICIYSIEPVTMPGPIKYILNNI